MSYVQYEGQQFPPHVQFEYSGSDTLRVGMAVCFNSDASTAAGRRQVEKPSMANIHRFAGIIGNVGQRIGLSRTAVDVIPVNPGDNPILGVSFLTDESLAAGDPIAPKPGSYYFGKSVVRDPVAVVDAAVVGTAATPAVGACTVGDQMVLTQAKETKIRSFFDGFDVIPVDDTTGLTTGYTTVADAGGVQGQSPTLQSHLEIRCDGDANDEAYVGQKGGFFDCATGKPWYFEALGTIDLSEDMVIGLHDGGAEANFIDDTFGIGNNSYTGAVFARAGTVASFTTETSAGATQQTTSSLGVAADATQYKFGIWWDGAGSIRFYLDDVLVATHSTTVPAAATLLKWVAGTKAVAAEGVLSLDYVRGRQVA